MEFGGEGLFIELICFLGGRRGGSENKNPVLLVVFVVGVFALRSSITR